MTTLPLEFKVDEQKDIETKDEQGNSSKVYKYRLKPVNEDLKDIVSTFWTPQFDEDILQPGTVLELSESEIQSSMEDYNDDDDDDDGEPEGEEVDDVIIDEDEESEGEE